MTLSAAVVSPPTMAAFRPSEPSPLLPGAVHGSKTMVNSQRYRTPIKLEFNIALATTAFNLPNEHREVLKLLLAKDPTLEIVPSKEDQAAFADLNKFPATENAYNLLFNHAVDKQPTEARKIIIAHSLITNLKFFDLKIQNAPLMDYMAKKKIWVHFNQSQSLQIAALGFIQDVHPRVTYRDEYRTKLETAIQQEMTEQEKEKIKELLLASKKHHEEGEIAKLDIKLEVVAHGIGLGNGAGRIKTNAFEVRAPLEIRLPIK
jgi:hypothetical protein